ncbi:integral membrane protein [Aspergillus californicus]
MSPPKTDRSIAVQTVAAVFMPIAVIAVMLRCYVRGFLIKGFGWDDGTMVVAMLFYVMFSACMIGGTRYGTGRKFENLTSHQRVTAMEYWWLCEIAYCFASIGCKVSVCIFLLRITVKRLHMWLLYIVMALTVISGLAFMFIMLLQCKPLEFFWTRTAVPVPEGHCIDIQIVIAMTYVYSFFAALCDFTVGILPIFIVHKLQMRKQTKLAVIGILSMACIASSAVIVRMPFVNTFADDDFLWATIEIAIWSNIETGLGITAGSLATLRPLLRHWIGSSHDASYNYNARASPFPGRSGSRLPALSRERAFPLGSLDDSGQPRLRPDKVAVTVTTVQSQVDPEDRWRTLTSTRNSSEERLTMDQQQQNYRQNRHQSGVEPRSSNDLGMGIHRVVEVSQTSTNVRSASVREHV